MKRRNGVELLQGTLDVLVLHTLLGPAMRHPKRFNAIPTTCCASRRVSGAAPPHQTRLDLGRTAPKQPEGQVLHALTAKGRQLVVETSKKWAEARILRPA